MLYGLAGLGTSGSKGHTIISDCMFDVFQDLRGRRNGGDVEFVQLLHIFDDAAELTGEFLLLVVRHFQVRQFRDVFHIGLSDFHT